MSLCPQGCNAYMVTVYGAANVEYVLSKIKKSRKLLALPNKKSVVCIFWCPDIC